MLPDDSVCGCTATNKIMLEILLTNNLCWCSSLQVHIVAPAGSVSYSAYAITTAATAA